MFLSRRTSLMIRVIRAPKSDDDSGLSLVIADTSQIIAVIRGPGLSHSPLPPRLPRNLNHGTLIGSSGIYKLPADWVSLPINWVAVRDLRSGEWSVLSVSDRVRYSDPDPAPITRRLKCQNWRLPLNLPSSASWTGCFLKHEKINSGELLSFKQHSKEGQAKLNPKTAKRSQHSMKDREKKQHLD